MRKNIICVILSVVFLFGCAKPAFHFVCKNTGINSIEEPLIEFDNFRSIGSNELKSDSHFSNLYVSYHYKLPEKVTVSWKTQDGQKHSVQVEVKSKAPKKFKNLYVYFLIGDDNKVTVKFTEE